jgi:hypothetical protein
MSARQLLFVALSVAALGGFATRTYAQDSEMPAEASRQRRTETLKTPFKDADLTLGKLFSEKLVILVKPPLPTGALNQFVGRSDRSGRSSELLTPGIAGVTVRFRW